MTSLHALMVLVALAGPDLPFSIDDPSAPATAIDVARLRELLYSRQNPQEQSQAALLLVQSEAPEAVELVEAGLRRQDRPDVFQALTAAIRIRRNARYISPLVSALGSDQAPVRQAAIDTLARLDNAAVVKQLAALAEDQAASLLARQAAAATLGRSLQKAAVIALIKLLANDSSAVRQSAAAALEELSGQSYGLDVLQWQVWWERQNDPTEQQWLAGRTAYFADRGRRLREDLQQAEKHIVQLQRTLYTKTPGADRPTYLRTLTQSDYPAVREQAIAWITEMMPEAGLPEQKVLIDLLLLLSEDGAEQVQRQAVLALEKVTDARAFDRLLVLLHSRSVAVRAGAARSLGRYRCGPTCESAAMNNRAIAALEKALDDSSLTVVAEAAESLGSLGVPEAAPVLAGLLRHPSDPVRQAAARALELVASPAIVPAIHAAMDDPVPGVRFSLVGALGRIGTGNLDAGQKTEILKRLETVLVRDGDPGVRSRAAKVMGDFGTAAELPVLWQRVTATEDNRVQLKAWTAMIEILSRSGNWTLVSQWEQTLAEQKHPARRAEMLTEIRSRWSKVDAAKPHMDAVTGALIHAQLAQRKWSLAAPLTRELVKKSPNDAELQKRLRWLLVAGNQALEDKKSQEALEMLNDLQEALARSGDLAPEFDSLRQRAIASNE